MDVFSTDKFDLDAHPNTCYIENFLYQEDILMVFGHGGSGKSLFALDLGYSLLARDSFLGKPVVNRPKCVLYVDGESSRHTLAERVPHFPHDRYFIAIKEDDIVAQRGFLMEFFNEDIDKSVIILDNITSLFTLDQNSQTEMVRIRDFCMDLRDRGLVVIVLHHANKSGGYFGTTVLERFPTSLLKIQKHTDGTKSVTVMKDRDRKLDWVQIRYQTGTHLQIHPLALERVSKKTVDNILSRIVDFLGDNQQGVTRLDLVKTFEDTPPNTVYVAIARLLKRKKLEEDNGILYLTK